MLADVGVEGSGGRGGGVGFHAVGGHGGGGGDLGELVADGKEELSLVVDLKRDRNVSLGSEIKSEVGGVRKNAGGQAVRALCARGECSITTHITGDRSLFRTVGIGATNPTIVFP